MSAWGSMSVILTRPPLCRVGASALTVRLQSMQIAMRAFIPTTFAVLAEDAG